jgi:hypothetical protein
MALALVLRRGQLGCIAGSFDLRLRSSLHLHLRWSTNHIASLVDVPVQTLKIALALELEMVLRTMVWCWRWRWWWCWFWCWHWCWPLRWSANRITSLVDVSAQALKIALTLESEMALRTMVLALALVLGLMLALALMLALMLALKMVLVQTLVLVLSVVPALMHTLWRWRLHCDAGLWCWHVVVPATSEIILQFFGWSMCLSSWFSFACTHGHQKESFIGDMNSHT